MPPDRGPLRIGAVLADLAEDFPDLTISKVRFLEAEGLLSPERTPSGYRLYHPADVDRLRFILTAQRDHFWPLKVIRERLDALDRGLVGEPGGAVVPPAPEAEQGTPLLPPVPAGGLRLTAAELREAADLSTDTFRELISYKLLDGSGPYDEGGLSVARAAAALVAAGIEVRHLRAMRSAADRDLALVEHVLGHRGLRGREAVAAGLDDEAAAELVAEQCLTLHAALVRQGLQQR